MSTTQIQYSESELVNKIIEWEDGTLDGSETLKLFSHFITTGLAWRLNGHIGRSTRRLIESGHLSESGEILNQFDDAEAT